MWLKCGGTPPRDTNCLVDQELSPGSRLVLRWLLRTIKQLLGEKIIPVIR